jgi:Ran-binding protein 1
VTLVTPDMKLSPNVGSDRSWVWNVTADFSEAELEAHTFAIRFLNSDSGFRFDRYDLRSQLTSRADANLFKEAFIKAQQENEKLLGHE